MHILRSQQRKFFDHQFYYQSNYDHHNGFKFICTFYDDDKENCLTIRRHKTTSIVSFSTSRTQSPLFRNEACVYGPLKLGPTHRHRVRKITEMPLTYATRHYFPARMHEVRHCSGQSIRQCSIVNNMEELEFQPHKPP